MTYPFRKRLGKHQAQQESKDDVKTKDSAIDNKITEDHQSNKLSETLLPEPPKATHTSTVRRVSPSTSLLDRYKQRAPASTAPSITAISSTEATANQKSGKVTSFSELFDHNVSPNVEVVSASSTPEPERPDPVRVIRGVRFNMLPAGQSTPVQAKPNSTVEATQNSKLDGDEEFLFRPRRTRSQKRREQRADSTTEILDQEAPKGSLSSNDDVVMPASLTIRKRPSEATVRTRTPSPRLNQMNQGTIAPCESGATPFNSPSGDRQDDGVNPQVEVSEITTSTRSNQSTPTCDVPTTSPSNESTPTRNVPPTTSFLKHKSAIKVTPPIFDPTCSTLNQWCDHRASSSRSEHPWGWMKKWTCCRCNALTMVEQDVCAKLACGHTRCKRNCKLTQVH